MPRAVGRAELFVWIPVALLELLEPRQLRAWAALAYAQARGLLVTEAELGQVLVHHSGRKAGEPIGAAAAGAVVDSLEALGFLVVRRRAGHQGRHQYLVLADPQPPCDVEDSNTPRGAGAGEQSGGSSVGDGSGSPVGDGSLAYSEDTRTDRLDEDGGAWVEPAVGEVQVGSREAPVENPVPSNDPVTGDADALALRAGGQAPGESQAEVEQEGSGRGGYTGPELTYSARMIWITEPVRWLLERSTVFVQRKLARDLAAQLAAGIEADRLRERLQRRFAQATPSEIRSPGGWLLKVGAPRWGCHDPKCESGTLWVSGEPCPECRDEREERRRARQMTAAVAAGACRTCLDGAGPCPMCQLEAVPPGPTGPTTPIGAAASASETPRTVTGGERRDGDTPTPGRCPECRSWASGRGADGRCAPCALQHAVAQAVTAAADGASAHLSGRAKVAAAAEAAADVRAAEQQARGEAIGLGLDEDELCFFVLGAAQARAAVWASRPGEER